MEWRADKDLCADVTLGMSRSMVTMMEFQEQKRDYECSLGHLVEGSAEYEIAAAACHQRGADRCLKIARLHGGVYVKAAQFIASMQIGSRDQGIPWQYVHTLSVLTDHAPCKSIYDVADVLREGLRLGNWPSSELDETCDLLSIQAEPIASGSLAQVHQAVLRDGTSVAVKVQYPELKKQLHSDLQAFHDMSEEIKQLSTGYDITWIVEDLKAHLSLELDFKLESQNMELLRACLAHLAPRVLIPKVFSTFSSRRVLTMEFCEGLLKLDDPTALRSAGLDIDECAALISDTFAEMIFIHGRVHADPHVGNIYMRVLNPECKKKAKPQLVILDHGLHHDLGKNDIRVVFCKFWKACCAMDDSAIEICGRHLAGKLFRMLPLLLSPWFMLCTPGVSCSDLAAAASGRLPDIIGMVDIADFLAAVHTGIHGSRSMVGLFHSLGYIRGLLRCLGFMEDRRLASMLKFAMLGDCPASNVELPRDLTFGQRINLHASIGWMKCQLSAVAPLARVFPSCCSKAVRQDLSDAGHLYGITQAKEAEPCNQELERLDSLQTNEAQAYLCRENGRPVNMALASVPYENPLSESAARVEQSQAKSNKVSSMPSAQEDFKDGASTTMVGNQMETMETETKLIVGESDPIQSAPSSDNPHARSAPKRRKASSAPKRVAQKDAKEEVLPKQPPNLTKEQAKEALHQAVQLLEKPKNAKKLMSAVKKARASSEDPFGQQLAIMENVLPLAQDILGELLDRYSFPREKLMLAVLQIQKHARGDKSMQEEVARLTAFLQAHT